MIGRRNIIPLIAVAVAGVLFAMGIVAAWEAVQKPDVLLNEVVSRFDNPVRPGDSTPRSFAVRKGESAAQISERLQSEGLIGDARMFRWMADLEGRAGDLAAGEYELYPGMKPSEILAVLAGGKTKPSEMVTIPEGWRSEEIAARVASRGVGSADQFVAVVRKGQSALSVLSSRPDGASLEGYLFPDSYAIDSKTTPESLANRMLEQFDARFTTEMREKAAQQGMTIHQVVTLASVIEREAVKPEERPLMAGVFYNRLKEGMLLQTDPTVQFAVATGSPDSLKRYGWWKQELTAEDLAIDSPYNTYRYAGLPPGPICNPGLASLRAAVEPEATDYLYFVAKLDGSHAFATTLEEHNANVARYGR